AAGTTCTPGVTAGRKTGKSQSCPTTLRRVRRQSCGPSPNRRAGADPFSDGQRWSAMVSDGQRWSAMVGDGGYYEGVVQVALQSPETMRARQIGANKFRRPRGVFGRRGHGY